MIGAMPAVAVRHERRKKKRSDCIIVNRPDRLLLKPHAKGVDGLSPCGSPGASQNVSHQGSPRAGTPEEGHQFKGVHYGDECFYGKISLLHFIVFFLMGGLTVIIVGAVQFKKEAGLSAFRYHFLVIGAILMLVGLCLIIIKCTYFRVPIPTVMEPPDEEKDEEHGLVSPVLDEKTNGGGIQLKETKAKEEEEEDKKDLSV